MMINRALSLTVSLALLSGCSGMPRFGKPPFSNPTPAVAAPTAMAPLPSEELAAPPPPSGAVTADALDTTTDAQKAAALAAPAPVADAALGTVVVALGNVTEPGFWLRSGLVSAATPGQVKTAAGATVQVDLMPGEGAAQMSLAAFRALNLGLTDLPEVTVYKQ